jgi:uncharacterized phage protein gp47/JayE
MSVSPDFTQFVDLTLYDKTAEDIYEAALQTLQSRIPDWTPTATNIEAVLLEALAVEVGETVFTLNRIPESMVRVLLSLYGVELDPGQPPTVDLRFTAQDTDGYVIPAGTEVALLMSDGEYMAFFTDSALTIPAASLTRTVAATATVNTNVANGIAIGTSVELVDAVVGVESVETATVVTGGTLPESIASWTTRGVQRLRRLVDTLVIPQHFIQASLEEPNVVRANAIDNYDPGAYIPGDPGDHPGNITVVVYGDGAPLSTLEKSELQDSLEQRASANLIVHVIDPTITSINVTTTISVNPTAVEADVIDAVEARLTEYLSPNTWPWAGTVRVNELISVIDQVPGVAYVGAVTVPASDITLGVGESLVDVGTLTITAV